MGSVGWGFFEDGFGFLFAGLFLLCLGLGFSFGFLGWFVDAGFELVEDGFGSVDDGVGEAGEAGDLDAVGTVGGTFDDLAEEDDFVVVFFDGDPEVVETRE